MPTRTCGSICWRGSKSSVRVIFRCATCIPTRPRGLPWRNHEWLAQVVLALSYDALGVFGLKMVKLLCTTITMSALAVGMSQTAAPPRVQRLTLLAAAVGMVGQIQFRPQLFTYALLGIVMATLAGELYRGRARLWPLIPMFALWANLHGGYLTGLAALGIFSVSLAVQEILAKREIVRAWRVMAVTAGCVLATLLNPFGTGVWTGVLHTVSDPVIKSNVQEWGTLPAAIVSQWNLSLFDKLKWVMPLGLFVAFVVSVVCGSGTGRCGAGVNCGGFHRGGVLQLPPHRSGDNSAHHSIRPSRRACVTKARFAAQDGKRRARRRFRRACRPGAGA